MRNLVREHGNQAPEQFAAWQNISRRNVGDEKIAGDAANDGADVEERRGESELVAVHVQVFFHARNVGIAQVGFCIGC